MRIANFKAENFQRLKVVEITPGGNIITIAGKCEQGKTTILDAIHAALGGGKMPEQPIRTGEKKAEIIIDLGEMTVTRTFTAGGSALKIENKDGFKASKPQAILDKLVGKLAFDPLEFARTESKQQVEMLLDVVNLAVDLPRLRGISGMNLQLHENSSALDVLNKYYGEVLENRKLTNRQLDSAKKILESLPEVEATDPVSATELVAERESLQATIRDNQQQRDEVVLDKKQIEFEENGLADDVREICELEQRLKTKLDAHAKRSLVLIELQRGYNQKFEAVKLLQDPDMADISERIRTADETNRQAQTWKDRQAKLIEIEKFQTESDDYTDRLKKIIEYKTEIVGAAKFPVPGLDFANGGVTYQGIPLKQASTAQALRVSAAVGMSLNPQLRIMLIDRAESLDSDQLRILADMAAGQDYQLWMTKVSEDEKTGIYIEDGAIKEAAV